MAAFLDPLWRKGVDTKGLSARINSPIKFIVINHQIKVVGMAPLVHRFPMPRLRQTPQHRAQGWTVHPKP